MSFSSDIKSALCKVRTSDCCALAQCYGMMLFSRTFSNNDVSVISTSMETASVFSSLLRRCFDSRVVISQGGSEHKRFKAYVSGEADRKKVINTYLHQMNCGFDLINQDKLIKDCCMASFLRGVFLSCGTISDPSKQYRLEFVVKNNSLAVDLYGILYRKGINPYMSTRGKYVIVYIKQSESIEDFLTLIDAPKYSLEFMGVKVYKDIRNNENRKNNFETANIAKTASAAVLQSEAINKLKTTGKLNLLATELITVANARLENPDASLSELLEIVNKRGKPLSRSGLNHRLSKLIELSKE